MYTFVYTAVCIQTHNLNKRKRAEEKQESVKRQTMEEDWLQGLYDEISRQVCFNILPAGRESRTKHELCSFIIETCKPGTNLISDELRAYSTRFLNRHGILHTTVNHSNKREWVSAEVSSTGVHKSTNGIESVWNRLRRFLHTYNLQRQKYRCADGTLDASVLKKYLNEFEFKWNNSLFRDGKSSFKLHVEKLASIHEKHGFKSCKRQI